MERSVAEKRTQVYFPDKLYRDVRKRAKSESKSVAAVVREAVKEYLSKEEDEKKIDWENDPFFKAAGFFKSGAGDLSINHDHYLYGAKKKPSPKR